MGLDLALPPHALLAPRTHLHPQVCKGQRYQGLQQSGSKTGEADARVSWDTAIVDECSTSDLMLAQHAMLMRSTHKGRRQGFGLTRVSFMARQPTRPFRLNPLNCILSTSRAQPTEPHSPAHSTLPRQGPPTYPVRRVAYYGIQHSSQTIPAAMQVLRSKVTRPARKEAGKQGQWG